MPILAHKEIAIVRHAARSRPFLTVLLLVLWPAVALCDESTETPQKEPAADRAIEDAGVIPEVVITATRVLTPEQIVPRSMTVVQSKRILERGRPSVLDVLDDQVGIWIEKRTAHTSDPVIRGLSGGNILALVDGHTLSTFWGEGGFAGDDMYGKIDPEMVERIEVVRGPSSVLYGSNALGGVINFITKASPFDYTNGRRRVGGRTRMVLGSNPGLIRLHQEVYGATHTLRWLVGGTGWDAADTRDGSGQVQSPTGGAGRFANARVAWRLSEGAILDLSLQHTHNDPIYRYYRPTQDNKNERLAGSAVLELDLSGRNPVADALRINAYFQNKRDTRRWFDATTHALQKTGVASWKTLQLGVQARRDLARHELTYGIAFEATAGESPDDEQFTETPVGGSPRKAAPDSLWSSLGFYVQDRWKVSKRVTLTGSVRVDSLRFSTEVDDQYVPAGGLDPKLDEFTDHQVAIVGGLQANVSLNRTTELFGGWTRGFRQFAPHFGVSQHGFGVKVPSRLLDPVTADQFEVGLKHRGRWTTADAAVYYTRFRNFQNVVRGTFQGQDWYDFNQDMVRDPNEDVYVTTGNGKARVYGVELSGEVNLAAVHRRFFGDDWTVRGGFAWNAGQDETNDIPMRHTHPAWGLITLRYEKDRSRVQPWFEVESKFVRHYDKIPPSRLSGDVGYFEDPQDSASGKRRTWGLPGYTVVGLRGGFKPLPNVTFVVGLDNLFDILYRSAHSRMDAAGRGLYATLDIEL